MTARSVRHLLKIQIAAPLAFAAGLAALSDRAVADAGLQQHSFQQGVNGYAGSADTYLRAAEAITVFGSEPEASIDASDGGMPSQALLRFDGLFGGGAGQIGADRRVVSATLRLFVTSAGSGLRLHEMLVPWNEATASWDAMNNGIQADGTEAALQPLFDIGANDGSPHVPEEPLILDLTLALQRMQQGLAPGLGWALLPHMPEGTNGLDFATREWAEVADRPLLTVITAPVPEPATTASLLAGLALLAGMTRRRRA